MSNNLPCFDKTTNGNYRNQGHRNKVKRLAERFADNQELMVRANEIENREQAEAFKAYRELRTGRRCNSDRDALLYHY
jgi:ribosomal 30S subunit maturation factor RimM